MFPSFIGISSFLGGQMVYEGIYVWNISRGFYPLFISCKNKFRLKVILTACFYADEYRN